MVVDQLHIYLFIGFKVHNFSEQKVPINYSPVKQLSLIKGNVLFLVYYNSHNPVGILQSDLKLSRSKKYNYWI